MQKFNHAGRGCTVGVDRGRGNLGAPQLGENRRQGVFETKVQPRDKKERTIKRKEKGKKKRNNTLLGGFKKIFEFTDQISLP